MGFHMESKVINQLKLGLQASIKAIKRLSRGRFALLVAACVIEVLSLAFPCNPLATLAMFACVILSGYLLFESRRNWILVIVYAFLAYSCYSVLCAVYLQIISSSPYQMFANSPIAWTGSSIMLAFIISLGFTTPASQSGVMKRAVASRERNLIIVILCAVLLLYFGLTGLSDSGSARAAINSTLYEYSIVFLIVGLYYAADDKFALSLFILLIAFRAYVDFSTGNRVTALEMVTVFFLMRLAYRARWKYVLPLAFVLFIALMSVGALRGGDFSISEVTSYLSETARQDAFAWDGGYAAYHTSLCVLSYERLLDPVTRLLAFPGYMLSISINFLSSNIMHDPVALARTEYWHMGGCYFPFHFHFYLGMFGVIISSLLVGLALRYFSQGKIWSEGARSEITLVAIWVGATAFRWIQYSPIQLLRGVAVVAIVAIAARLFHVTLQKFLMRSEAAD